MNHILHLCYDMKLLHCIMIIIPALLVLGAIESNQSMGDFLRCASVGLSCILRN